MSIQQITSESGSLSIERACELLNLPRIEYYRWIDRADYIPTRTQEDLPILEEIREIIIDFTGYGYRRVTKELQNRGYAVNHKRVLKLMHDNGLLCKKKRPFVPKTTDSDHDNPVYPNLIKGLEITHPDQVWAADITYIHLDKGFAYLACILDIFTRKCIGWNMSNNLRTDLAMDALEIAIDMRWNSNINGLIHHSDRGVQYTSHEYTNHLRDHGIQVSMSIKGNPYDNAYAESFFKTLKVEEVYLNEYSDINDAWDNIQRFIEDVYNEKRLHSALGYMSPVDFEKVVTLNTIA
jgi:putative transposase